MIDFSIFVVKDDDVRIPGISRRLLICSSSERAFWLLFRLNRLLRLQCTFSACLVVTCLGWERLLLLAISLSLALAFPDLTDLMQLIGHSALRISDFRSKRMVKFLAVHVLGAHFKGGIRLNSNSLKLKTNK